MKNTENTLQALQQMFAKRPAKRADQAFAPNIKPVYCNDGTSLSVQASRGHYCFPRTDEGPYTHVEVGFPSIKPPESWREYCDGDYDTDPLNTVYGRVPLELVAQMVEMHGGLKESDAPATVLPAPKAPVKRGRWEQRKFNLTVEDMGTEL